MLNVFRGWCHSSEVLPYGFCSNEAFLVNESLRVGMPGHPRTNSWRVRINYEALYRYAVVFSRSFSDWLGKTGKKTPQFI